MLDLAPGRSMVEWLVRQGQQVFVISWRNPDAEQGHFDLDTYAAAVLEARDAVAAITKQPRVHLNGACSGGIIGAGVLGHLAAARPADRRRERHAARRGARQRARRHGGGARRPRGRRRGGRRVGPPRLPRRPGAQRRLHVAAAERPRLELRRQQLPAGQGPAGVRRPLLEPGHGASGRRPAPRLHPPVAREPAHPAGRADRARDRRRPRRSRPRQLCRRRPDRPHHPVGERLPQHAAARRRAALRALDERPYPGARQPARARTVARATDSPTRIRRTPRNGRGKPRRARAAGGPTTTTGSPPRSGALKPAPKRLGGGSYKALAKAPGTYVHAG